MFGIGMPELILILAIALIVIGPNKLPDLAKSLGKAMGEFKKATRDLKDSMQIDSEVNELKTAFDDINRDVKSDARMTVADAEADEPPGAVAADAATDPKDPIETASAHRFTKTPVADSDAGATNAAPATETDQVAARREE